MSQASVMTQPTRPRHTSRLLLHASWGLAATVFFTIGWLALEPWDPQGPVSVLTHDRWTVMGVEVLALAAVMSAIATALAGRVYPDVGVFAVCAGVAAASLRGDTMSYLLLNRAGGSLIPSLLGDALFWCVVVLVAMSTAAWMVRWCRFGAADADGRASAAVADGDALLNRMAAPNIPTAGIWLFGGRRADHSPVVAGLKHLMLATGIAVLLISFLLTDGATPNRAIRHGQACFAVAVGIYIGVGRAQAAFPVRSTFWPCLSVPVVCLIAYAWSWFMSPRVGPGTLASVPTSGFLRVLPVTYIMLGTCAALLAVWPSLHAAGSGKRQGAPSPDAG